jgi:hypothetical protein
MNAREKEQMAMSRELGRWQRLIMARLAAEEIFFLWELLPDAYTAKHRLACNRAAHRLAALGWLSLGHDTYQRRGQRRGELVIGRPGVVLNYRTFDMLRLRRMGYAERKIADILSRTRGSA